MTAANLRFILEGHFCGGFSRVTQLLKILLKAGENFAISVLVTPVCYPPTRVWLSGYRRLTRSGPLLGDIIDKHVPTDQENYLSFYRGTIRTDLETVEIHSLPLDLLSLFLCLPSDNLAIY